MPTGQAASGPDLRRQRWVEHRRLRRAEFVTGALAAVRQHGAETGLEEMAEAIGVSKSVGYRHFADREDLFETVLASIADEVLAPRILRELAEVTGGPSGRAALDQAGIRRIVRAFVAVVEEEPQLYRFTQAHASAASGACFERRIAQALAAGLGER